MFNQHSSNFNVVPAQEYDPVYPRTSTAAFNLRGSVVQHQGLPRNSQVVKSGPSFGQQSMNNMNLWPVGQYHRQASPCLTTLSQARPYHQGAVLQAGLASESLKQLPQSNPQFRVSQPTIAQQQPRHIVMPQRPLESQLSQQQMQSLILTLSALQQQCRQIQPVNQTCMQARIQPERNPIQSHKNEKNSKAMPNKRVGHQNNQRRNDFKSSKRAQSPTSGSTSDSDHTRKREQKFVAKRPQQVLENNFDSEIKRQRIQQASLTLIETSNEVCRLIPRMPVFD